MLAVCWGSANAQTATLEIVTDLWGYEAYWETTPVGDACGVNTILSGGNTTVGCGNGCLGSGAGGGVFGSGDPGAYANSSVLGPITLGTAPISFDFHEVDAWGDGGTVYNFYVDGVLQASVTSPNAASCGTVTTVNLVAGVPGCMDEDAINYDAAATEDNGSCIIPSCDVDDNVPPVATETGSVCYANNDFLTFYYDAGPGETVTLNFTGGTAEDGWDGVIVYDGANPQAPQLGIVTGDLTGFIFESTGQYLTFELIADGTGSCATSEIPGPITWDVFCGLAIAGPGGCLTPGAINFNASAAFDDGSCILSLCGTPPVDASFCYENTVGYGITIVADVPGVFPSVAFLSGIVEAGFDALTVYDGTDNTGAVIAGPFEGDLAGLAVQAISDNMFIEVTADGSVSCGSGSFLPVVYQILCGIGDTGPGCDDPTAFNYDPFASSNDGSCIAAEPNNACADAIAVACGSVEAGSTVLSNDIDGLIGSTCGNDGGIEGGGVWYVFNGTGDLVTISTCNNADFDTRLTVFEGACGALNCVTGSDDAAGCAGFTSEVLLPSDAGLIYYIYVHGFGGQTGNFVLSVDCAVNPCDGLPSPANDDCSAPEVLTDGLPGTADLCCSNPESIATPNALTFNQTFGVWFAFDNSGGGFDGLSWDFLNNGPAGTSFVGVTMYEVIDPAAYILDPCDGANLVAIAGCGEFAGQCQTLAPLDILPTFYVFHVWTVTPLECGPVDFTVFGEVYGCTDISSPDYNAAATFNDGSCTYPTPPANDLCAGAIDVTCGSNTSGSTGGATNADAPAACGPGLATGVWYHFVGTDNQLITVALCGSPIDATLAILEGACGAQTCVDAEDDDLAGCGFFDANDPTITFLSVLGQDYYFYVGGFAGEEGVFGLDVSCADVTPGCTDPSAFNYNPAANEENGTCTYVWADACNAGPFEICYDNNATQSYTYCTPNIGTDAVIITFGGASIVEEAFDVINIYDGADNTGTLLFSGDGDISGLTLGALSGCITVEILSDDIFNCADGLFVLGVNFDITCELLIQGCTDAAASNYNAAANVDNGTCQFCGVVYEYCYGNNENFVFTANADPGNIISLDFLNGTIEAGFDAITVYDGPSTASPVLFSGDGNIAGLNLLSSGDAVTIQITSDASFSCADLGIGIGTTLQVAIDCGLVGCDNPFASNYDPLLTIDYPDCNLCEFNYIVGCTYPDAVNYNILTPATWDDGTCIFSGGGSCPEDINGDGVINTGDLNAVLGLYGTNCI